MLDSLEPVDRELSRIGLLLQHDRELPSVTTLIAGEPIAGSWWGHPLGHRIYDALVAFETRSSVLSAKVVDGKITYVHERLWPAFLRLVFDGERTRSEGLSEVASALWKQIQRDGTLRADEPGALGMGDAKRVALAGRELEQRLLVHATSLHTPSGAHTKVFRAWALWADERGVPAPALSPAEAQGELESALGKLCEGVTRKVKVALLEDPAKKRQRRRNIREV